MYNLVKEQRSEPTMNRRIWIRFAGLTAILALSFLGAGSIGSAATTPPAGDYSAPKVGSEDYVSRISAELQQQFDAQSPGTHLEYWVMLADQADTTNNIPNSRWADKGWYVYNTLVSKAHITQA